MTPPEALSDRPRLEHLFTRLIAAFAAGDHEVGAALWGELDAMLSAHFQAEDAALGALLESRPRDARMILQEHRHLRARLRDLRATITLHGRPAETARSFLDELFAHFRHEAMLLGR